MQIAKKYLSESLIQLTILLSLIGVRVDIDSYLNGYYSPLIEINLGASSAYTQTPFHNLRDNLDGYSVHPKCPELDYFFASRRLLEEVRTLGSPRFPTQLNAWLVHQVSANDEADRGSSSSDHADSDSGSQGSGNDSRDGGEHLPERVQGPSNSRACGLFKEDDTKVTVEDVPAPVAQLAHSSTLEPENLLEGVPALTDSARVNPPTSDIDQHWNSLLSVSDLDDLDLVTDHQSDISTAISQDVSLHDAMLTGARRFESTSVTQQQRTLFRLESTESFYLDSTQGSTSLPFSSVCNLTENQLQPRTMGGSLDEAVFDQINQLGFEGLDCIDDQLMGCLECIDPQVLEDLDSDSGLSLETSSGGPVSPGSSEISSSSSYSPDECGATGYSSEMESVPSKNMVDYSSTWSTNDFSESVWHDHSYSSSTFFDQTSVALPHKAIKEEPLSDDDDEPRLDERELSRDELRARALCIPYSVLQIVNMPVEEFLEVLDGHDFSPEQVTLLRDIRRRGKNKLAAQNCRKRKLDAITGLQEEVERLRAQRDRLVRDKHITAKTMGAVGQQIKKLTRDIISRLRDDSGRLLNPERFTLQCGANGRVVVQPVRQPVVSRSSNNKTDKRKKDKKQ